MMMTLRRFGLTALASVTLAALTGEVAYAQTCPSSGYPNTLANARPPTPPR